MLYLLSLSSALPSHTHSLRDVDIPSILQSHQRSKDHGYKLERHKAISLAPRTGLTLQSFLDIGSSWNMYYSFWNAAALPLQPAVWALTNLHATLQTQAHSTWRKVLPTQFLNSQPGEVQLMTLYAEQPIPGDFVERFARAMMSITNGGWTGVYQFVLSQTSTDVSIRIELRILPGKV